MWTLKRKTTSPEEARIKKLEERLDAAVAESQRMRREMDVLERRSQSAKPHRPQRRMPDMDTFNPDDTVN